MVRERKTKKKWRQTLILHTSRFYIEFLFVWSLFYVDKCTHHYNHIFEYWVLQCIKCISNFFFVFCTYCSSFVRYVLLWFFFLHFIWLNLFIFSLFYYKFFRMRNQSNEMIIWRSGSLNWQFFIKKSWIFFPFSTDPRGETGNFTC